MGVGRHHLMALSVLAEFEQGSMNTIVSQWPRLPLPTLPGFLFYFTQAILCNDHIDDAWMIIAEYIPDDNHP